jgi:DNA-binding NtrC family response regulator
MPSLAWSPSLAPDFAEAERGEARQILVVDADPKTAGLVWSSGPQDSIEVLPASDWNSAWEVFKERRPRMVLLDLSERGVSGLGPLDQILEADAGVDVVPMAPGYGAEIAVESVRRGAYDFLSKPLSAERLGRLFDRWLEDAQVRKRALQLDAELLENYQFEGLVGRSPSMLELFSRIRRIAPHFQCALVTGDTGTGKELVATAIHRHSPAADGPFAVCNCAAIVETLFESELFGHVRGAFTGATQDRQGLIEYADGGVVFLDEIGELPLATQAKLLRVLQNREIQRLGDPAMRTIDVRVVAATNRDLGTMVSQKQFREDLFYRLAMVELRLPRLTERREDLPLLIRHFLQKFAQQHGRPAFHLTRRAQAAVARYSWPGNVRELENALGYGCMMAQRHLIDVRDLPEHIRNTDGQQQKGKDDWPTLHTLERRYARKVLEYTGGNRVRAAEILGVSRPTLYRILAKDPANGQPA